MTKIYLGNQPVYDPLVLPNNSRINGVEHFYQTTKPTIRGDGSALVVGDRWWKTDDGTEWFWNGTYWLSSTIYYPYTVRIPSNFVFFDSNYDYFIEHSALNVSTFSGHDESNYYYYKLEVMGTLGTGNANNFIINSLGDTIGITSTWEERITIHNVLLDTVLPGGYKRTAGYITQVKIGSPPTAINYEIGLRIRRVFL